MEYRILAKGQVIADRYQIEKTVGRGKSSAVYAAFDRHMNATVGLKILDPFLAQDPTSFIRFQREALIIRHIDHPHIIKVFDLLQSGAMHIIAMEYFESVNLQKFLKSHGPLSLSEFLVLARKITGALESCHRKGVLHRDIKPHNILINSEKEIKLVDFGISKINSMSDLTKTGTAIGTPEYMAPELFRSTHADQRSDIYSLGVVMYELLTGQAPYRGANLSQILTKQMSGEYTPISHFRQDIPDWLQSIINKCLHLSPNHRYQSCHAIELDLEKTSRAEAFVMAKSTIPVCAACREELVAGMIFCHMCGKFIETDFEKGNYSMIMNHCDDPAGLALFFARQFPSMWSHKYRTSLEKKPILIAKKISEKNALSLSAEMAPFFCEVQIVSNLSRKYPLEFAESALTFVPLLYIPFAGSFPVAISYVFVSFLIATGAFFYRTQALLSLKKRSQNKSNNQLSQLFAQKITRLRDKKIKYGLARIARTFIEMKKKALQGTQLTNFELASNILSRVFEAAHIIESYELHLSSTSLNALKEKCQKIDAQLKGTPASADATLLIEAKANAYRNFQNYREIQDAHGQLTIAVVNFENILERIGGSPEAGRVNQAIDQELGELDKLFSNLTEIKRAA